MENADTVEASSSLPAQKRRRHTKKTPASKSGPRAAAGTSASLPVEAGATSSHGSASAVQLNIPQPASSAEAQSAAGGSNVPADSA